MLKILGVIDLMIGLSVLLVRFGLGEKIALVFGVLAIIKGFIFLKSFVSWIDIIAGVVIIVASFGFFGVVTWVAMIWFVQKGVFSVV